MAFVKWKNTANNCPITSNQSLCKSKRYTQFLARHTKEIKNCLPLLSIKSKTIFQQII